MAVKRKLSTIFCADAQGYSRLMALDEADTLERLGRYRAIMEGLFARHGGRKVNTWGDAVIAEFESVVEAVRCAVEIQDAIGAENRDLPPDRRMLFRIGINLGDVMEENGDIYGDGVNVAARLEAMAEPGGIMVSRSVYDFSHRQLAVAFDFAGNRAAKEGEDPVPAFRVRLASENSPPEPEPTVGQAAAAMEQAAPGGERVTQVRSWFRRAEGRVAGTLQWLAQQPRQIRFSAGMIFFFFAINALFSGIADPWFIFPSLPFALHIFLHARKAKRG
jgi:adenylate cyclase